MMERGSEAVIRQTFIKYSVLQYSKKYNQPNMTTFVCTFKSSVFSGVLIDSKRNNLLINIILPSFCRPKSTKMISSIQLQLSVYSILFKLINDLLQQQHVKLFFLIFY